LESRKEKSGHYLGVGEVDQLVPTVVVIPAVIVRAPIIVAPFPSVVVARRRAIAVTASSSIAIIIAPTAPVGVVVTRIIGAGIIGAFV
jgi:hypothetical protein